MRAEIFLALPLFLVACFDSVGEFEAADLSCEHDPHGWFDNPFASLLESDGGAFDIDPHGDIITGRSGVYDLETGAYSHSTSYHADYPTVSAEGEGYGTIYDNGDLDLITKVTYEDVLGERWASQVRTKREGCTGSVKRTELGLDAPVDSKPDDWADSVLWTTTIVSDTQVDYHAERDEEYGLYISDTSVSPDHASQGSFDYADGAYVGTSTMLWDGTGASSWEQYGATFGSESDYIGDDEYFMNGSRLTAYDVYAAGTSSLQAEVELLWLYDGSATGDYTIHDSGSTISCEVTITVGGDSCTMVCVGYGTYDC
jgi:hypothetical protein